MKLVSPEELIKARDEKRSAQAAKAAKKAALAEQEQQRHAQKLEQGRIAPQNMFRPPNVPEGTYSSWSSDGIPLTDGKGDELSMNHVKRLRKVWNKQEKLHEEFLAWETQQGQ